MAVIVKHRTNIFRLFFGAALWCILAGCFGPLVYRPEKAKKISKPVKAAVTVTKNHLPPVPDVKANNATLSGIDTTGTGIRDDVYVWIYKNYSSTKKRIPIMGMAKTLQLVVANTPKTTEDARKLEQSFNDALLTLKAVPNIKPSEADGMDLSLYQLTVNTPERLKAYLQYSLLLGGVKDPH